MKTKYNIEITDTFGGEANYCWVKRYSVMASSFIGAMRIASRDFGGTWRKESNYGDMARYNMRNACICAFIIYSEE